MRRWLPRNQPRHRHRGNRAPNMHHINPFPPEEFKRFSVMTETFSVALQIKMNFCNPAPRLLL